MSELCGRKFGPHNTRILQTDTRNMFSDGLNNEWL